MENKDKQILLDIANRLELSTKKDWDSGDIEEWSKFGNKMSLTIDTVVPMIKTLASTSVSKVKQQKVLMTRHAVDVNNLLQEGWKIISVTSQVVSVGSNSSIFGEFCFLLEK